MDSAFSSDGGDKQFIKNFKGNTLGKRSLGRPRMKGEDNTKMHLINYVVIVGGGWNWIQIVSKSGIWY
jgi:hypothetical protein